MFNIKAISISQLVSWLIGIVFLIIISTMILNDLSENAQLTFDPKLYYWISFGLYLLIGIFLALVVLKMQFQTSRYLGLSILIFAIITLGIALALPLSSVIQINSNSDFLNHILNYSRYEWISILSGFLLTTSVIIIFKSNNN